MPNIRTLSPYILPLVFAVVMALFHVPEILGAHPWWAIKVIWIGLPVGVALAFLLAFLGVAKPIRIAVFIVVSIGAFYAAIHGKTLFVNSYSENALAGKFWYFGWIGTMAAMSGLIFTLVRK